MKNRTTRAQWSYRSKTTRFVVFASMFNVCADASLRSISAGSNGTGDPAQTVRDTANLKPPPVSAASPAADLRTVYRWVQRSARQHVTSPRRKGVKTGLG